MSGKRASSACGPDSTAKVIDEFMMYEPVTATDHEMILATTSVVVVALPHWQKSDNEPMAAIPDAEPLNTARASRNTP